MTTSPSALPHGAREHDTDPLVLLRGIEKSFDHGAGRFHVLRRIDLAVRPGEFVSVMGPSGAGKSTLLNIVGCMDGPTSGTLRLLGSPIENVTERERTLLRREQIGFVDFDEVLLQETAQLQQVRAVRGDGVLRQPVLEPQRVAESVEDSLAHFPRYGFSSNSGASCISSQRLASRR